MISSRLIIRYDYHGAGNNNSLMLTVTVEKTEQLGDQ